MSVTFSIAVKDDANADKLVVTAKGLVDADGNARANSWKVEVHDRLWPASKTMKHEQKKLEKEANWKSMTLSIKPKASGRILVWRAQADGAWTDWTLLDVDAARKKAGSAEASSWESIFTAAGYVPPEPKEKKKAAAGA